jgi:hypothetical protein
MRRSHAANSRAPGKGVCVSVLTGVALFGVFAAGMSHLPAEAQSQPSQPVAIVEDINGSGAGVGVFEYLEAGRLIRLSADEVLVLGYLRSCIRETIHGGEVTVGAKQSSVTGGLVIREEVECDGGSTELSVAEASQSGVITFRKAAGPDAHGTRSDPIKIFSADPVFMFSGQASELILQRLDQAEAEVRLPVRKSTLNLADHNLSLASGGLYEARAGADTLVFEIASHAGTGGPLVGRVIRF